MGEHRYGWRPPTSVVGQECGHGRDEPTQRPELAEVVDHQAVVDLRVAMHEHVAEADRPGERRRNLGREDARTLQQPERLRVGSRGPEPAGRDHVLRGVDTGLDGGLERVLEMAEPDLVREQSRSIDAGVLGVALQDPEPCGHAAELRHQALDVNHGPARSPVGRPHGGVPHRGNACGCPPATAPG